MNKLSAVTKEIRVLPNGKVQITVQIKQEAALQLQLLRHERFNKMVTPSRLAAGILELAIQHYETLSKI